MSDACCQGGDAESKGAESNFGRGRLFRRSGGGGCDIESRTEEFPISFKGSARGTEV